MLRPGGIKGTSIQWHYDPDTFRRWARGETGFPFVDASMRELDATGWMSNRYYGLILIRKLGSGYTAQLGTLIARNSHRQVLPLNSIQRSTECGQLLDKDSWPGLATRRRVV